MAITDSAGNALQVADATGQMLGYDEPATPDEVLQLRMYDFFIEPIRRADVTAGKLFLQRFLEGPQEVWESMQQNIFSIKDLWDVTRIEDRLLIYLKNIVGWTPELEKPITERLDADTLRRLISVSTPLWKIRGTESSYLTMLAVFTTQRVRIWNWFDLRWILDESAIGQDHQGRDIQLLDLPGGIGDERRSNIRIVDPDGSTLDRMLIRNLVRLWRPSGERVTITYLDFMDLFQVDGVNDQWESSTTDPLAVADGVLALSDDTIEEHAEAATQFAATWSDYIAYWRVRGNGAYWGVLFYWTDADDHYRLDIIDAPGEVDLLFWPEESDGEERISGGAATFDGTTYDAGTDARVFDGLTDRIDYAAAANLVDGVEWSMTFWVNPANFATEGRIWSSRVGASSGSAFVSIMTTGRVRYFGANATGTHMDVQSVSAAISLGSWQHVTITSDGSNTAAGVHIYVNGVETTYAVQTDGTGTLQDNDFGWHLGGRFINDTVNFAGSLRNFKVFPYTFTPAQALAEATNSWGQLLRLVAMKGGVESTLAEAQASVVEDVYNGVRVHVEEVPTGTRVRAYLDGDELIDYTDTASPHTQGSIGVRHPALSTLDLAEVELFQLPAESDDIDINTRFEV